MGDIGVLVVHGIGEQERGETQAKLLAGLRQFPAGDVEVDASAARATVGGQPVRLYEVYWADLLKGDDTMAGAFFLPDLASVTWFPWLNTRKHVYRAGDYSRSTVVWWCVVLPIVNFLALLAYWGTRLLVMLPTAVLQGMNEPPRQSSVAEAARAGRSMRTIFDRVLDEYAGDVFAYVNSAGHGFYREPTEPPVNPALIGVYPRIVQTFYEQLLRAHADGCTRIQIVAHSLGTVVTYHALSGLGFESARHDAGRIREAIAAVSDVYTIGSPLEKIRFLWPGLQAAEPLLATTLRWNNFVSWFDPVAGTLRRFNQWGPVNNRRLLGGGFIRGHVVYERSPVFLQALVLGLCGRELPLVRTTRERWTDRLLLLGETLVAPLGLAAVLMAGVLFFAIAAGLLPFLVSLPLRPFMDATRLGRLEDAATLVIIGLMAVAFLFGPMSRAGRQHALYSADAGPNR